MKNCKQVFCFLFALAAFSTNLLIANVVDTKNMDFVLDSSIPKISEVNEKIEDLRSNPESEFKISNYENFTVSKLSAENTLKLADGVINLGWGDSLYANIAAGDSQKVSVSILTDINSEVHGIAGVFTNNIEGYFDLSADYAVLRGLATGAQGDYWWYDIVFTIHVKKSTPTAEYFELLVLAPFDDSYTPIAGLGYERSCFLTITEAPPLTFTPIQQIQYTEDPSGDSPKKGEEVTFSGIITAETYAFGGSKYWIQDANEPWAGIMVYDRDNKAAEGDSVTITGTVDEYWNLTEIKDVTAFTVEKEGVFGIEPLLVTSGDLAEGSATAEQYEGCLVKVMDANITVPANKYGEWQIDDGSGVCVVDSDAPYFFDSAAFTSVQCVTGVVDFGYGIYKIQPRLAMDVVEEGPYTRFQRIQQVRYSDLMKAGDDAMADTSYYRGDTLQVKGVVTMPTGLSYAGPGIKFIFGDPAGGPWSSILSYNPDSTAYPALFEGDVIEMNGWIDEYSTGVSNMTELWITSPINILDFGQPVPAADSVKTGDLRWPTSAEQWGNVSVELNNAVVTSVDEGYLLFRVDDGSGSIQIDDDSDSLSAYPDPPIGTEAKSIRGWVYHHYGSYSDSSAYQVCPLYTSDIIWGAGPPAVSNSSREKAYVASGEGMPVSTTVQTTGELAGVTANYKVNDGDYMTVELALTDGVWAGEIPAQEAGSFVSYYFKAEDTEGQMTTDPADIETRNYSYIVKDEALTIKDLQYTPWPIADTPFEGQTVTVEGIVTADTSFANNYDAYVIQSEEGAWNGIYVFGALPALSRGDKVRVTGVATDYNPDWAFKWDNNTTILAESAEVLETVAEPAAAVVTTGELAQDAADVESWEGSLVKVENLTLTSINSYDVSVSDGSGECLLDADGFVGADQDPNPFFYLNKDAGYLVLNATDTVRVGDTISMAQGIFTFSFGTFKIEIRDLVDMGVFETGVETGIVAAPLTYELEQNFPNPFNPETRIYFSVPETQSVKLYVYNVMGQQVRQLVDAQYTAGHHVVNWDGRDQNGRLVPTGVYFYRIKAGDFIDYKKMTLMK